MTNRRQTYLINPVLQRSLGFAAVVGLVILVNTVLGTVIIFMPGTLPAFDFNDAVAVAVIELFAMGLVYQLVLRFTHRLAGPAHAICRELEKVAQGNLCVRVNLREGDYFAQAAETVNQSLEALAQHIEEVRLSTEALARMMPEQTPEGQAVRQLLEQMAWFKVPAVTNETPVSPVSQEAVNDDRQKPEMPG
ncbi:putative HAMP domain-containing protein [Gammaproteobacteria bacterium]